jgi:hypothetical protein
LREFGRVSALGKLWSWLAPPQTAPDEVAVAVAPNEPLAQLMSQRLRSEGIPSNYQSVWGAGFSAPWNPIWSPREIIVNAADAARAKEILATAGHPHYDAPRKPKRRRRRS